MCNTRGPASPTTQALLKLRIISHANKIVTGHAYLVYLSCFMQARPSLL